MMPTDYKGQKRSTDFIGRAVKIAQNTTGEIDGEVPDVVQDPAAKSVGCHGRKEFRMLQNPMHPGEVLKELYLLPLKMSSIDLARELELPRTRIERLVKGSTGVTTDTAVRLARFFSTTPQYWLNMQNNYDLAHDNADLSAIKPLEMA